MKVTYQTCCGVDVHNSFLVATIIKTTSSFEPSYQKQRFSTFNNSILKVTRMIRKILNGLGISAWTGSGSYVPCKKIRIMREYTRYRYKLVSCRSSEKNRYQNALTVCNVALDSVVSDIFGKSSPSIIEYLLEQLGTSINHEEIASNLLKRLQAKEGAVFESIEGYR